jgi:CRISPR-associated endonuclease/helicase Cas3
MVLFYAHTHPEHPDDPSYWEPFFTEGCPTIKGGECEKCQSLDPQHGHLNKVAYLAGQFAANMFSEGSDRESARQWGYLAGLWHDLGKFAPEWQTYLKSKSDPHSDEVSGKVDHSTAGAQHAISSSPLGHFIATAIAGHHAGLLDARHESHASLEKRLNKSFGTDIPNICAPKEIAGLKLPEPPAFLPNPKTSPFSSAFFQRMLFSCLVDADFLATEAFMNPEQAALRPTRTSDIFHQALKLLETKIAEFGTPTPGNTVATARNKVVQDCTYAASSPSGIFTLTVPTGGGKTLSSLNFALRHAISHGKKRIIYVVPFTSIIEQNATVFRDLLAPLGENTVIEHHANLAPEQEENQTTTSRLATENWEAPIIVTTAVQFYESLYAAKTSRSRKLHNIANSIVILDEAQCLPIQYLNPCLRALKELAAHYHTTIVLCTATQPAVAKSNDFPVGFPDSTEIIRDTETLFAALARVDVTYRGGLPDASLASELATATQALCIVNTRKHARSLFEQLPSFDENFHLSTLMCPQHRLAVLAAVRQRLSDKRPVRLISTQLIEAGVDIDFPLVYRSMAGLDSIAQAAGRCNREGKLPTRGQTHVFHSEHTASERHFAQTANVGHEILDLHASDPLSTNAVQAYFNKFYHQQKSRWDSKDILNDFKYTGKNNLPFLFNYRTAAEKFQLIENQQIPIIIPWTDEIKQLIDRQLRPSSVKIHRQLLRTLQRYTVQIYDTEFRKNHHQFESLREGQFHLLICPETHYSKNFGLNLTDEVPNSKTLICG